MILKKTPLIYNLLKAGLFSGILLFSVACNKECEDCPKPSPVADTTKPVITVHSPGNGTTHTGGQDLIVNVSVWEDRELSQVKIEIHNDFDNHGHGKSADVVVPFDFDTIISTSAKEFATNFSLALPTNIAAGKYHFIAYALDKAGNEAHFVAVDLHLLNPDDTIAPLIALTHPDFSGTENDVTFASGQDTVQLRIAGAFTDQKNNGAPGNLKGYEIFFYEAGHAHKSQDNEGSVVPIYKISNFNIEGSVYDIDMNLILRRRDLKDDEHYDLKVVAYDNKNNKSERTAEFHVELE